MWALLILALLSDGSILVERRAVYDNKADCESARPHSDSVCVDMKNA